MRLTSQIPASRLPGAHLPFRTALSGVVLLWMAYTVLQTLFLTLALNETLVAILEFIPGILAVAVLVKAGFSREECFLRLGRISWQGLLLLAAFSLIWPLILSTGSWIGWDTRTALVQGAGGISQELFFRAALLPALLALFKARPWPALLAHTFLFAIWHAGAFFVAPANMLAGPIAIVSLSLVAGLVWGWQTLHDRTVYWAMLHHSLLWVIGSMFYLGPPA